MRAVECSPNWGREKENNEHNKVKECGVVSIVDTKTTKAVICENCDSLRDDDIGDSGDNRDSTDLFFDEQATAQTLGYSERVPHAKTSDKPLRKTLLKGITQVDINLD